MALLVRTWNVYHGRTHPQSARSYLERMIRLITLDAPDIVALQEVPVWALGRLERWSGMTVRWAITVPAILVAPLARFVTDLDPVRVRSTVSGQANAILFKPRVELGKQRLLLLTPEISRWQWLLGDKAQQRYCQAVELEAAGRRITVANLHATNNARLAEGEVGRAADFVARDERVILCGDFNVRRFAVPEFSPPIDGIDQILVSGLDLVREPVAWEPARRRLGRSGRLLSDHAPVEAVVA